MQRLRIRLPSGRIALGLLSAGLVFGCVMALRLSGALMPFELAAYDRFLSWRTATEGTPRVVLVVVNEADIKRFGFPIPNDVLADALRRLSALHPRAIGVDLYRPPPAAQDPIANAAWRELEGVVLSHPSIVLIHKLADAQHHNSPAVSTPHDAMLPMAISSNFTPLISRGLVTVPRYIPTPREP